MSQPVTIGNCQLYCGDCREILPTISAVDAIITDPVWPNVPLVVGGWDFLQGGDRPYELFKEFIDVMPQLKRLVVVMRHDSDPRILSLIPQCHPFFIAQILQYVMPGYIGRKLGGNEIAYGFGDPIPSAPGQRVIPSMSPKIQPDGRASNGHPCSRALAHFIWLGRWWSEPRETILDPFMGSGTTGVAAAKLGRKFIGIEIDQRYFDIACQRIEEAYNQPDMFIQPPATHEQIEAPI